MKVIFLLCLLSFISRPLLAQEPKMRVAVFDPSFSGKTFDESTVVVIREMISSTIVNSGKYNIVERSLIDKILREQKFSNSGAVDADQISALGKLAGANKVILSVLSSTGSRHLLSLKMIDVESANVESQKTRLVKQNEIISVITPLALELIGEENDIRESEDTKSFIGSLLGGKNTSKTTNAKKDAFIKKTEKEEQKQLLQEQKENERVQEEERRKKEEQLLKEKEEHRKALEKLKQQEEERARSEEKFLREKEEAIRLAREEERKKLEEEIKKKEEFERKQREEKLLQEREEALRKLNEDLEKKKREQQEQEKALIERNQALMELEEAEKRKRSDEAAGTSKEKFLQRNEEITSNFSSSQVKKIVLEFSGVTNTQNPSAQIFLNGKLIGTGNFNDGFITKFEDKNPGKHTVRIEWSHYVSSVSFTINTLKKKHFFFEYAKTGFGYVFQLKK